MYETDNDIGCSLRKRNRATFEYRLQELGTTTTLRDSFASETSLKPC